MKKFISILLATLILFSAFFSISAFATENTVTEDSAPVQELLSPKWVEEHGDEYAADATVHTLGILITKGELKVKGNESAAKTDYQYGNNGLPKTTVYNNDGNFMYYHDLPFFYAKVTNATNTREDIEYTFIESYEEDFYYVEYYKAINNREARMYFKDGELKKYVIKDSTSGLTATYEYIITSYEVDDNEVKLPSTAIFDITFIYNILKLFGVVS